MMILTTARTQLESEKKTLAPKCYRLFKIIMRSGSSRETQPI